MRGARLSCSFSAGMMKVTTGLLRRSALENSISGSPVSRFIELRQTVVVRAFEVDLLHPLDGSWDTLLQRRLWIVPEGASGPGDVRPLILHIVLVFGQVSDVSVVATKIPENQIAQLSHTSEFFTSYVVHLTGNEIIDDVGQRRDEVVDKHENAMVAFVDLIRQSTQGPVNKQANYASIIVVVLSRTIGVEETQSHALVPIALLKVHDLDFVHPLGHSVVVVLDNRMLQGDVLAQDVCVFVAVDLG